MLEKKLFDNQQKGIVYHYEGKLVGDYDKLQSEAEIIELMRTGEVPKTLCEGDLD